MPEASCGRGEDGLPGRAMGLGGRTAMGRSWGGAGPAAGERLQRMPPLPPPPGFPVGLSGYQCAITGKGLVPVALVGNTEQGFIVPTVKFRSKRLNTVFIFPPCKMLCLIWFLFGKVGFTSHAAAAGPFAPYRTVPEADTLASASQGQLEVRS